MKRNTPKERFSKEFRNRALKLLESGEMSAAQIARDLGITPSNLSRWKKNKKREEMRKKGIPNNSLEEAMKTIKKLEKELAIAEEERDILKKAVSFFAKI